MALTAQPIYIILYLFKELYPEFICGGEHILSHILEDDNSVSKLESTLQILIRVLSLKRIVNVFIPFM